jgi:hypothetical protein
VFEALAVENHSSRISGVDVPLELKKWAEIEIETAFDR